MRKSDPWYVHAALYFIIIVLTLVLVKVAIIDPKEVIEKEKYYRKESRLRMDNLKEAQILYEKKYNHFAGDLDSLINFIKNDPFVDSIMTAFDSLTRRPANPFTALSHGEFTPESLYYSPKTHQRYILQVDTSLSVDTVVNQRGRVLRIDSTVVIGSLYYIEDPDGYGTIGSITDQALKNTASWE